MKAFLKILTVAALVASGGLARAVTPDEMLADPALEARARDISQLLRCVVCQNQSIDDSSAPLAHDLRVLVRERLTSGDSNKQAMAFIVARYGNFVLLKPPFQFNTFLLWIGPALLLVAAVFAGFRFFKSQAAPAAAITADSLSESDQARLAQLLPDHSDK